MPREEGGSDRVGKMNRRMLLSTVGTSAAIAGLPGVYARGGDDVDEWFKRTIEQANRLRENVDRTMAKKARSSTSGLSKPTVSTKYGEVTAREAWRKFLQNKGVAVATKRFDTELGPEPSGGFSTQRVQDVDTTGVDGELTLTRPSDTRTWGDWYYAELDFRLYFGTDTVSCNPLYDNDNAESCASWGEPPLDTLGLGWDENCWDYDNPNDLADSTSGSENVTFEDSTFSLGSIGFEVDDDQMWEDYKDRSDTELGEYNYTGLEHGGVFLDTTESSDPDCTTEEDTTILATYDHTWTGTFGSFSVSVGVPASIGVSYSQTSDLEHESTTTEKDGTTPFRLSKDDVVYRNF